MGSETAKPVAWRMSSVPLSAWSTCAEVMMSPRQLPAPVFNRRVTVQVREFYRNMEHFFQGRDWPFPAVREKGECAFEQHYFTVSVGKRFEDGAVRCLVLQLTDVPGIARRKEGTRVELGWRHRIEVDLPRSYPLDLHRIRVGVKTPVVNPRLSKSDACLIVRGDVDRVLADVVFHVLLEPSRVKPPKMYPGMDHGLDTAAMRWYQEKPGRPASIHNWLLTCWEEKIRGER